MNIEREFIERRAENRRAEIRAGISQLFERRQNVRRADDRSEAQRSADNTRISAWIEKFERARNKSL